MMTATPTLTAADRCDRCGAQAYVRTEQNNGLELLWCAHHWRGFGSVLLTGGARIVTDHLSLLEAEQTVNDAETGEKP